MALIRKNLEKSRENYQISRDNRYLILSFASHPVVRNELLEVCIF